LGRTYTSGNEGLFGDDRAFGERRPHSKPDPANPLGVIRGCLLDFWFMTVHNCMIIEDLYFLPRALFSMPGFRYDEANFRYAFLLVLGQDALEWLL